MAAGERTYTFIFTDIEGSTRMLRALGDDYERVLREHDAIVAGSTQKNGGRSFGSEGDAQHLVFDDADAAIAAAVDMQRALARHPWPEGFPVRVRMGIHSGSAREDGGDFVGLVLHEAARIASAGHGGQVLVSAATRELARRDPPADLSFRDLGQHAFKDFDDPVRVYQLDIEGLETDFAPIRSRPAANADLPAQLTGFVGRSEVEAVSDALSSSRLITLTGPGGTGKTRLSIEVATRVASRFPDGTQFVALDAVTDPALVSSEITTALGLVAGADPPLDRLLAYLADRTMLLLLDNMEQVVAAGDMVARLARECPGVSFIVTSRIPLRVYGEHEFPVPALSTPTGEVTDVDTALEFEAVRLFVERARAARPGFEIDDANVAVIADIVGRLDGLPLAIELATARLRMLPLESLRDRLDDRLGVLTGGARDRPGRQQTLRGAIEWSHDLLDEPDRKLFARFGVISGGAAFPQIEHICGPREELQREVFDGLDSLSQQSLIRSADEFGSEPRFEMLATIREYARERLDEGDEAALLRRRHAEVYVALAEEAAPHLLGQDGATWNDRLEADHDDLRAALDWIVEDGDVELGLRMVAALWRFWQIRGHLHEGQAQVDRVLDMPSVKEQPPELIARAEAAAGGLAYWRSDSANTHRHYSNALEAARKADDRALLAEALYNFGFATGEDVSGLERYSIGEGYFTEALEVYRDLGDRPGEANALWALAQAAEARGDQDEARRWARQTLEIARELDSPFQIGWAAFTLAVSLGLGGDSSEAAPLFLESLDIFIRSGDRTGILLNIAAIGHIAVEAGDEADGWRLVGATDKLKDEIGAELVVEAPTWTAFRREPENDLERSAHGEGAALSEDAAVELARSVAERLSSSS